MKKFAILLTMVFYFVCPYAMAEGDLWDNYGDQNTYGQKPVTDKEFNSTIDRLLEKKNKNKKNKDIPKGEEFHQANETDFLKTTAEELPILLVPLRLEVTNADILPIGYYQVIGEKIDGSPVIKLYQSEKLLARFPAIETKDDFNEAEIRFVRLLQFTPDKVKIIFGSVDFNAYSIINIAE